MTLLIVPCYNETDRLRVDAFQASNEIEFLFVDDGSRDGTPELLRKSFAGRPGFHVHVCEQNGGKAEAIRAGVRVLAERDLLGRYAWVGFWDADLATPLSEVPYFLSFAECGQQREFVQSLWGSRVYRYGSRIERSWLRHYLGRGFATVVSSVLRIESYDSQCGAKLFRSGVVTGLFREPFLSRWIFDLELALRMKQTGIVEVPLREWRDIPGSKLKVGREILRVLRDLWKIRGHYLAAK